MNKLFYVPAIAMCVLLGGCSGEQTATTQQETLAFYTQMTSASMEAVVTSEGDYLISTFTLHCDYQPQGETVVEVLEPETMAGVRVVCNAGQWVLEYDDMVFNVGTLSSQGVSPLACMPLLLEALSQGWMLAQSSQTYQGQACDCLTMDYSDETLSDVTVTAWLSQDTGAPVGAEIAVDGQRILQVLFTSFEMYGILPEE